MINLKVNFANGDHLHTRFNGSFESAESYYVGKPFNIGNVQDNVQKCTSIELLEPVFETLAKVFRP